MLNREAETLGGGLQEVAVSGGALGVQLEIFYPSIVQNDQLDVLATDINDHVGIVVKLERRLGVRDGFDQGNVSFEDILQDVLGVAGSPDSQNLKVRVLCFHLLAQVFEHVDSVLDGIAVRKLIGLAENVSVFIQQDGLGGG